MEAAYSIQLDYDAGNEVTIAGYAALWRWSRDKVRRFFEAMGVMITYPEETARWQNQRGKIVLEKKQIALQITDRSGQKNRQIRLIDNKDLEEQKNRSPEEKKQITDRSPATTIDTRILDTVLSSTEPLSTCPHQAMLDLFHEVLPEFPTVRVWSEKRKAIFRARWKSGLKRADGTPTNSLEYWRQFFEYVRDSDWLMGKVNGRTGRPFKADLEWLITESNFIKIIEGKYHG